MFDLDCVDNLLVATFDGADNTLSYNFDGAEDLLLCVYNDSVAGTDGLLGVENL